MTIKHSTQKGAALFVALVFLVVITLISITAMRSSTLELLMATNEQGQRIALESVQSASTAVINSNNITIGSKGEVSCFGFGYDPVNTTDALLVKLVEGVVNDQNECNNGTAMVEGTGYGTDTFIATTMQGFGNCPPSVQTSVKTTGQTSLYVQESQNGTGAGSCKFFTLDGIHDAIAKKGGRSETLEGFILGP